MRTPTWHLEATRPLPSRLFRTKNGVPVSLARAPFVLVHQLVLNHMVHTSNRTIWFMEGDGRRRGKWQPDQLTTAATDYVIEHGLSDLSLRRLGDALGVSHRTLLYHFGSREALYQAILREARTRERLRAVSRTEEAGEPLSTASMIRATWKYLSGPREHKFWRFYFEVHGLALQNPERYQDVLHGGVDDWLTTARDLLLAEGLAEEQADAIATLLVAAFRGLMLDLLSTGENERVDAGFEVLATLADALAGRRDAPAASDG